MPWVKPPVPSARALLPEDTAGTIYHIPWLTGPTPTRTELFVHTASDTRRIPLITLAYQACRTASRPQAAVVVAGVAISTHLLARRQAATSTQWYVFATNFPRHHAIADLLVQQTDANNPLPSVQPGASQTGAPSDYSFYYDRNGNNEHMMSYTPAETPAPPSATAFNPAAALPFSPYANANPYFTSPSNLFNASASNAGLMSPVSPWNTHPYAPSHPNAAGLGRQDVLPQPIGTRPTSNGGAEALAARLRNIASSNIFDNHATSSQHFPSGMHGKNGNTGGS